MRLNFSLKAIKIDPASHIQINRHAEQYNGKCVTGLLYGELYDDAAHITNILPFPQSSTLLNREDTIAMEKRHDERLNEFHLDDQNIGFYFVSYSGDFWEELQNVKLYEDYKNTSFFVVYDYQARILGKNPYNGYRLTDEFFQMLSNKTWNNFKKALSTKQQIFQQIPVLTQKNQLFELLMLFNNKNFLKKFIAQKQASKKKTSLFHDKINNYMEFLTEQHQNLKKIAQSSQKTEGKDLNEEKVPEDCFYQTIAVEYKAKNIQQSLQNYRRNLQLIQKQLA